MNKTEMMADRLREIAREYNFAFRTLNQAADMIENQARHIEALQVALETERHNHDRLQDWDRGMTEKLEQAQKRIAELEGNSFQKCNSWVSVADRLPEEWRSANGDLINYMVLMPVYGVDIGNFLQPANKWLCMGIPAEVTHWMPLPEGPEVEV